MRFFIRKWEKSWKWLVIYFITTFEFSYAPAGYFDNRHRIVVSFPIISAILSGILWYFTGWMFGAALFAVLLPLYHMKFTFILPFYSKWTYECDPPRYGIAFHNGMFWLYLGGKGNENGGGKWWTYTFPFINRIHVRHSILLNDDTWEHELRGENKQFYMDVWDLKKKTWKGDFIDKYDGAVIPATIHVSEREWRPKWLTWTKMFAMIDRTIDVHFSAEVGRKKGSWKGGTIGCGHSLLPGEDPLDCLKRMGEERDF